MLNKEFLKTLTVLYTEDDIGVREVFGAMLGKIFKEVILCANGLEGLERFKTRHYANLRIDIIISDINMPKMNGLDMLEEIRKIDYDTPAILTTAHGESNCLLKAIEVNISYYALKPVNTPLLLENIQKICMIRHSRDLIIRKEKKLSAYIKIIGQVATIVRVDKDGYFIDANELFCEISLYNKNEIIGKHIKDITHNNILTTVYVSMEESIQNGENWEGRYKNIDKEGTSFYLKTFAIPEYDDNLDQMNGCVFIGFITTEDEQGKRDTMQKVRQNIIEQRKKETELNNTIKKLEHTLKQHEAIQNGTIDIDFLKESLEKYKTQSSKLTTQVAHYENDMTALKKKLTEVIEAEVGKRQELTERNEALMTANATLKETLISLQTRLTKLERSKK